LESGRLFFLSRSLLFSSGFGVTLPLILVILSLLLANFLFTGLPLLAFLLLCLFTSLLLLGLRFTGLAFGLLLTFAFFPESLQPLGLLALLLFLLGFPLGLLFLPLLFLLPPLLLLLLLFRSLCRCLCIGFLSILSGLLFCLGLLLLLLLLLPLLSFPGFFQFSLGIPVGLLLQFFQKLGLAFRGDLLSICSKHALFKHSRSKYLKHSSTLLHPLFFGHGFLLQYLALPNNR
jgi:hypothetical protein